MLICIGGLNIIGLDNDLSPGWSQAIIWTNTGILLIVPLGTNFSEILIQMHTCLFRGMHLKMSSRPQFVNLDRIHVSHKRMPTEPLHNIPSYMKEVAWLKLCLGTNGHRSSALEWLPFILPPACVCTSSSDKELIRPVCSLIRSINSFHNRLMLRY